MTRWLGNPSRALASASRRSATDSRLPAVSGRKICANGTCPLSIPRTFRFSPSAAIGSPHGACSLWWARCANLTRGAFEDWGVIDDSRKKGEYALAVPRQIADPKTAVWLLEAAVLSMPDASVDFTSLLKEPLAVPIPDREGLSGATRGVWSTGNRAAGLFCSQRTL